MKVTLFNSSRYFVLSLKTGPIIILIPWSYRAFDAFNVSIGLAFVSPGTISNFSSLILLSASLVDLIMESPIVEYSPVNGTTRPILILSSANILLAGNKHMKININIFLNKDFI